MALAASEEWRGGFVVDKTTGQIITSNVLTNAQWSGGFLRDPDGRLVVKVA